MDQDFLHYVKNQIDVLKKSVDTDPYITSYYVHYSSSEVEQAMDELYSFINETFDFIKENHTVQTKPMQYTIINQQKIALSVDGRVPIQSVELQYSLPITSKKKGFLSYWEKGIKQTIDISHALTIKDQNIFIDIPLMANIGLQQKKHAKSEPVLWWIKADYTLSIKPSYYEISLVDTIKNKKKDSDNRLINVNIKRQETESPIMAEQLDVVGFESGSNIIQFRPFNKPKIWSGIVHIKENTSIDTSLVIKPGTKIVIHQNASLFIKGKVLAIGTKDQPIAFEADNKKVWGTIALIGNKANGSVFKHCVFQNGSGYKTPMAEYSAMLSIHDVQDIVLESVHFKQNHQVDDMVHAVYSSLDIIDCRFEGALSDALDLDICKATIKKCYFENNGNDGLDLMTSDVEVINSIFKNNGDKGISVGEGSKFAGVNNQFIGNTIGIQAKDNAGALIFNSDFLANDQAIDAYKKNWRYGNGGYIYIAKSIFKENKRPFSADKHSQVYAFDSYIQLKNKDKHIRTWSIAPKETKEAKEINHIIPLQMKNPPKIGSDIELLIKPKQLGKYENQN